jgi:hypothetical protein
MEFFLVPLACLVFTSALVWAVTRNPSDGYF